MAGGGAPRAVRSARGALLDAAGLYGFEISGGEALGASSPGGNRSDAPRELPVRELLWRDRDRSEARTCGRL
ncbi:hypothetical protein NN561_019981 [Cricetulus griseus]